MSSTSKRKRERAERKKKVGDKADVTEWQLSPPSSPDLSVMSFLS
jgi:hypothetical protein